MQTVYVTDDLTRFAQRQMTRPLQPAASDAAVQ